MLVHGLMGRGSTWSRQSRGCRDSGGSTPTTRRGTAVGTSTIRIRSSTERFVADLADAVAELGRPATLIGHSMGGLHSWCLAAARPDLVSALVIEDMAPDFRGRTTGPWEPWLHALPIEFDSAQRVLDEFGAVAGRYFLEAFDRTETGWRLHGHTTRWIEIAAQWGTRDYWEQWRAVRAPALLIEAGNGVTPPGQMREMARPATGSRSAGARRRSPRPRRRPAAYREAVESFLATLTGDA